MRECLRCGTPMTEGVDVMVYGSGIHNVRLQKFRPGKLFPLSYGSPMAAICPNCGEVSLYVTKKRKKKQLPEL